MAFPVIVPFAIKLPVIVPAAITSPANAPFRKDTLTLSVSVLDAGLNDRLRLTYSAFVLPLIAGCKPR